MKFKVLFIVFNIVILASFVLIFLMPAFVLGWEYTGVFWSGNWPVGLVFLVVLAGLNGYFFYNWRVFTLLEREDWDALVEHLEREAYERSRVSRQRVRILINSYVVTGQVGRISDLEAFVRRQNPRVLARLAIEFGLPYLLSNDGQKMIEYFGGFDGSSTLSQPLWVRWCLAFGLMSLSRFDDARAELTVVLQESHDILLRSLTAHMLEPFGANDEATRQLVKDARAELRKKYSRDRIDRELEQQRQNLQVLFLSSRIEEARDWVFRS